MGSTTSF
jgi:predicted  nucleic acid-binding Zn-ribbon protein